MINDFKEKINPVVNFGTAPEVPVNLGAKIYYWVKPFYVLLLIFVVGSIFFALGRISAIEAKRTPIQISYPSASSTGVVLGASSSTSSEVIGSKTGKKYYFPWCGTLKRVKPENQIHFTSVEEARSAGYLPAANCKGLK